MKETKKVFLVMTNSDRTEGTGSEYPIAICESIATAYRVGKRRYIQGTDCPVVEGELIKIDGEWFISASVFDHVKPNDKDIAIEKAISLGLSYSDIEAIR